MKIEIHGCSKPPEEEPVILKLLPRNGGPPGVKLCVVDRHGDRQILGPLLTIDGNGEVELFTSVGNYGFHWDKQDARRKEGS